MKVFRLVLSQWWRTAQWLSKHKLATQKIAWEIDKWWSTLLWIPKTRVWTLCSQVLHCIIPFVWICVVYTWLLHFIEQTVRFLGSFWMCDLCACWMLYSILLCPLFCWRENTETFPITHTHRVTVKHSLPTFNQCKLYATRHYMLHTF